MRVPLLIAFALTVVFATLTGIFALAIVARRDRVVADREVGALLVEATAQLDQAEAVSTLPLHKAWFHAFAADARATRPLRSARALAEWTSSIRHGHAMVTGLPAEKLALEALAIAGEIAAHRRAPRGMR